MTQQTLALGTARSPLSVAYGVGVDSTAMLVGYYQRGIRPDLIIFSAGPRGRSSLDALPRSPTNVFYDPVYAGTCCVRNASRLLLPRLTTSSAMRGRRIAQPVTRNRIGCMNWLGCIFNAANTNESIQNRTANRGHRRNW